MEVFITENFAFVNIERVEKTLELMKDPVKFPLAYNIYSKEPPTQQVTTYTTALMDSL